MTACGVALALAPFSLAGCHAYDQTDADAQLGSAGQLEPAEPAEPVDAAVPLAAQPAVQPAVFDVVPAQPAASYPTDGAFSANEVLGTRIYTPYYSVLIPYGYWLEGYTYSYDPTVDENGLGHVLVVTHPAAGAGTEAMMVYTYDASSLGFAPLPGEYVAVDLGFSQTDVTQGVALAEGYAQVGWDVAQADIAAFAPNVAGVDWY